jgi:hypothetical protein
MGKGPDESRASRAWLGAASRLAIMVLVLASVVDAATADPAPTSGRISVGRAATVEGATVRLADVAVLEGSAADFAGVDLGPAPDPGGSRHLDGIAILHKLRAAGLDDGTTRYEIPASVRIARAYQDVSADEIRGAVERDASSVLGPGEQLRNVDVGSGARIPPGPYELRLGAGTAGARGLRRRIDVELVQEGESSPTCRRDWRSSRTDRSSHCGMRSRVAPCSGETTSRSRNASSPVPPVTS